MSSATISQMKSAARRARGIDLARLASTYTMSLPASAAIKATAGPQRMTMMSTTLTTMRNSAAVQNSCCYQSRRSYHFFLGRRDPTGILKEQSSRFTSGDEFIMDLTAWFCGTALAITPLMLERRSDEIEHTEDTRPHHNESSRKRRNRNATDNSQHSQPRQQLSPAASNSNSNHSVDRHHGASHDDSHSRSA
mmetsp:Transcript_4974/g.13184  ORF Transcript_4974/g.13184 Transcript_4974/m.13184 type:complete len:193 (+) Transcript_4974:355-933(+)